jgi:predicted RNase H-like HicB family nuclease
MIIRAVLEWDDEVKAFSATCPELNYISSCGDTKEEAIANLKEAIQCDR